jgi:CelD/BcsL family acetyltransferase involved in cellulose biosynthesis
MPHAIMTNRTQFRHSESTSVARTVTPDGVGRVKADVIQAAELSGELLGQWDALRSTCCDFTTPFFSSRYTQVVGQVRPQSKIAVISRGGNVIGFLPFEFANRSMLEPIGKAFNDAHGLICEPGAMLNYCDVLQSLGVKSYRFHALAGPGTGAEPYTMGQSRSFLANLEAHPEGYVEYLESTRATILKQRRKTKKLSKDLGPVRLELDCRDSQAFEELIRLKREQYQRTFIYDILSVSWAKEMLHTLWAEKENRCRGLLSVLYAGDTIIAAHYGMLEDDWLHYWFPVYDPKYQQYSPGTAMFLEIAKAATAAGIKKIDLGYGEQAYKHKFVDTITEMPYGCITSCRLTYFKEQSRRVIAARVKQIPGKPLLKRMLRGIWPSFGSGHFS